MSKLHASLAINAILLCPESCVVCQQKSPPLRKGTRARAGGQGHADIAPSELRADPGMVLNYKPQEQAAPAAAQPAPDLLDFDGLSMDGPPAAASQAAAPRQVCQLSCCDVVMHMLECHVSLPAEPLQLALICTTRASTQVAWPMVSTLA